MCRAFFANKSPDLSISSASGTTICNEALSLLNDVEATLAPTALNVSIEGLKGAISHETDAFEDVAVDLTAEMTDGANDVNDQATEIAVAIPDILANANAELEVYSEVTFEGVGDGLGVTLDASIEPATELDSSLTIPFEDAGAAGQGIIAGGGEVISDVELPPDTAGDGSNNGMSETAADVRATIDIDIGGAEDGIDLSLEVSGDAENAVEVALDDIEYAILEFQATIEGSELVTTTTEVATDLQIALEGTGSGPVADLGANLFGEADGILPKVVAEAGGVSVALLGDEMSKKTTSRSCCTYRRTMMS
ncbi:hypothetical protein [Donghicola eburneus]|uniref:hypothetical protein n=1 Tax=Donghicola eburneus TaxID=393278 RepID=UPI0008EF5A3C|nr:hypothetical protein [Donghicola eburneus]SFQ71252.1 hypothetical protein SAMN05421764_11190 [Donghicola eburneus]